MMKGKKLKMVKWRGKIRNHCGEVFFHGWGVKKSLKEKLVVVKLFG
jgi:hypothetical protein